MYLKSLEVQGFKSFANKIVFEFHNGITGIVGPNGSGKSNVGDAVRWVLGEQSAKQLRGGNMQDVIFSGTETRKPLGFAYVAITLDNTDHKLPIDYEEVTVSRRVYRSGESEYQINGTSCRLKDINELFYDTGIGKEGYSIIGQGQIDKILSGKPEERRELFDEAAGIVKFKRRKNTAQKKLEAEKQNLVRVNDILSELTKQLEPLEKQSQSAKIYLKKKDELKIYDSNLFLLEIARIKEQLSTIEEKSEIAHSDLEQTKEKYENTKLEYEKIQQDMEVLDQDMEQARSESSKSQLECQQMEGQVNVLKEQINTAKLNDDHYQSRLQNIQTEIKDKQIQLEDFEKEKKELQEQLDGVLARSQKKLLELTAVQNKISEYNSDIESCKSEIIELLNQRGSTKGKMQRYKTMQEQIQIRKAELNQKVLLLKSDESEQEEKIQKYENDLLIIKEKIVKLDTDAGSVDKKIQQIQQELAKKNRQLEIGQTTFHREESRLESLKNITERYDGYGNSIRRVMSCRDQEKGILGVVADIVKVEKKFETAIETALGGSIQNIVTSDEAVAKRMIEFLKKNKYGRATFLPLTSVQVKNTLHNHKVLNEPGVLGVASQLAETDHKFKDVADYLLGRTIVAESIDKALIIAKKYGYSFRIVTLEGELLSPGGSMTGGAFKNAGNLLGRRREIEELQESVELLKKDMAVVQSDIENLRSERNELRDVLVKLNEKRHEQSIKQNTAAMHIKQLQSKKADTQKGYADLTEESEEIEQQMQDIREKKEEIQTILDHSVELEEEYNKKIKSLQVLLEDCKKDEENKQKQTEEIHLELSNLKQKDEFIVLNEARIIQEIEKLENEFGEIENNAAGIAGAVEEKESEISRLRKEIEKIQEVADNIQQKLKQMQEKREEMSSVYKTFFTKQEELSNKMNLLDKECLRLSNQQEKMEENRESLVNYMWEEYELTGNQAKELQKEELKNPAQLKKMIGQCKDEIRALGDVNVNAIEDYKNLAERHAFLAEQHDDLIEAEQTLLKIIEELDEGMRRQFQEKFAAIQIEFDKAFKQLFGGGKGSLQLMEDEDILEAGIKIISQPPGKKLQNMMQLSGGEKALTAIALLFAIQNLKPSPFCLLDEIEAALDDSNVSRYAQYLHKLTRNTQFIIITHRRGTMAAADRLYGITMQEKGVSTLVSVNLIEEELDK